MCFCFVFFLLEAEQNSMQSTPGSQQSTEPTAVEEPPAKKTPCCRKCHQPMRGHAHNQCPVPVTTQETTNNHLILCLPFANMEFFRKNQAETV